MISQLMRPEFMKGQKYQEQQWRAVTHEMTNAEIIAFKNAFIKKTASLNVPFFALCIYRTAEEQASLFDLGVSRDDSDDGVWPHQFDAVDLIHGTLGYNLTKTQWSLIGHIGKEVAQSRGIKITWGGDWKFYDPAHWEITGWNK